LLSARCTRGRTTLRTAIANAIIVHLRLGSNRPVMWLAGADFHCVGLRRQPLISCSLKPFKESRHGEPFPEVPAHSREFFVCGDLLWYRRSLVLGPGTTI